jgi:hypothetical protein
VSPVNHPRKPVKAMGNIAAHGEAANFLVAKVGKITTDVL